MLKAYQPFLDDASTSGILLLTKNQSQREQVKSKQCEKAFGNDVFVYEQRLVKAMIPILRDPTMKEAGAKPGKNHGKRARQVLDGVKILSSTLYTQRENSLASKQSKAAQSPGRVESIRLRFFEVAVMSRIRQAVQEGGSVDLSDGYISATLTFIFKRAKATTEEIQKVLTKIATAVPKPKWPDQEMCDASSPKALPATLAQYEEFLSALEDLATPVRGPGFDFDSSGVVERAYVVQRFCCEGEGSSSDACRKARVDLLATDATNFASSLKETMTKIEELFRKEKLL
jgi:hypothetical protein